MCRENEQSHKEAFNDRISKADHRIYGMEYQLGKWSAIYTFARWEANRAARSLLPQGICRIISFSSLSR